MSLDLGGIRYASSHPLAAGVVSIDGIVARQLSSIVSCPRCGGKRLDHPAPHAPHFNADNQRIDCVGNEVSP